MACLVGHWFDLDHLVDRSVLEERVYRAVVAFRKAGIPQAARSRGDRKGLACLVGHWFVLDHLVDRSGLEERVYRAVVAFR